MVSETYLTGGDESFGSYASLPSAAEGLDEEPYEPPVDLSLGVVQYDQPAAPAYGADSQIPYYEDPSLGVQQYAEPAGPAYGYDAQIPGYDAAAYQQQYVPDPYYEFGAEPYQQHVQFYDDLSQTEQNIQAQLDAGLIDQDTAALRYQQAINAMTGESERAQQAQQYAMGEQFSPEWQQYPAPVEQSLREQGIASGAIRGDITGTQGFQALGDIAGAGIGAATDAVNFAGGLPLYNPFAFSPPTSLGYTPPTDATRTLGEYAAQPFPGYEQAKDVGGYLGELNQYVNPFGERLLGLLGTSGEQLGRGAASVLYPETYGQATLELLPGIGGVPGIASFADDAVRLGLGGALRGLTGGAAREGVQELPEAIRAGLGFADVVNPNLNPLDLARFGPGGGPSGAPRWEPPLSGDEGDYWATLKSSALDDDPEVRVAANVEMTRLLADAVEEGRYTGPYQANVQQILDERAALRQNIEQATPSVKATDDVAETVAENLAREGTIDLAPRSVDDFLAEASRLGVPVDEELLRYGNDFAKEPELIKIRAAQDAERGRLDSLSRDAEGFHVARQADLATRYQNAAEESWFDFIRQQHQEARADAGIGVPPPPAGILPPGRTGAAPTPKGNAPDRGLNSLALQFLNVPRSAVLGGDLGYAMRQAGFLAPAHINTWRRAMGEMVSSLTNVEYARQVQDAITAKWAERGLKPSFFDWEGKNLSNKAIEFYSPRVEQIPGVGRFYAANNRAQSVFLNKMISDLADDFVTRWQGKYSDEYLQHYLNYLARATGQGNLGGRELQTVAAVLSNMMISPRFTTSLVQRAGYLNPMTGGVMFGPVWREAMQDTSSFLATGTAIMALAGAAGATVTWDPRDTDFGRIQLGDTRVDVWAGYRPLARAIYQGATGQGLTSTGKLKDVDALEVAGNFLRDRLTPAVQLGLQAYGDATGKSSVSNWARPEWFRDGAFGTGKWWDQVLGFAVPAFLQDAIAGVRYDGLTGGVGAGLGAFFGLGMGSYNSSVFERQQDARNALVEEVTGLRGLTYDQLTPLEKSQVTEELARRNPELVRELEKAESEIKAGKPPTDIDRAFSLLDETKLGRAAIEQTGDARLQSLLDRITAGERGDAMRRELQDTRAGIKTATDALYNSPEYKDAQKVVGSYMDGQRVAGAVGQDLLSSKPGTLAGSVVDFLGIRRNEAPGDPLPNAGPFQKVLDVIRSIPEQTKAANNGFVDWNLADTLKTAALDGLRTADPEWAQRIETNTQPKPSHPIEELYFSALRSYDVYQNGDWWPAEGAKWTPQDYNAWIDWRVAHPQDEALMYLYGYVEDVTSQEAVNLIHQMSPGAVVTVRR